MKTKLILISLFLLATAPVWAAASLNFTTIGGTSGLSWTITNSGGVYAMNFYNIVVDSSSAGPSDNVVGDFVGLPNMTVTSLTSGYSPLIGNYYAATLVPAGPLTITDNLGAGVVLTANLGSGGVLYAGTNFQAYSVQKDDLDIISPTATGYSDVIDEFVTIDGTLGGFLDLSFTGDDGNIYNFFNSGSTNPISGNLSGQINGLYIPAPGAILLGGIGVSLVGWLRRRRTL